MAGIYPWANTVFDRLLARPLLPVAHKPLISYALSWLVEAGICKGHGLWKPPDASSSRTRAPHPE